MTLSNLLQNKIFKLLVGVSKRAWCFVLKELEIIVDLQQKFNYAYYLWLQILTTATGHKNSLKSHNHITFVIYNELSLAEQSNNNTNLFDQKWNFELKPTEVSRIMQDFHILATCTEGHRPLTKYLAVKWD